MSRKLPQKKPINVIKPIAPLAPPKKEKISG